MHLPKPEQRGDRAESVPDQNFRDFRVSFKVLGHSLLQVLFCGPGCVPNNQDGCNTKRDVMPARVFPDWGGPQSQRPRMLGPATGPEKEWCRWTLYIGAMAQQHGRQMAMASKKGTYSERKSGNG